MSRFRAVAVALCLVLVAGCSGGSAPTTDTPTTSTVGTTATSGTSAAEPVGDYRLVVTNGTLPVNATLVFERVLRLTDGDPPERVEVVVQDDLGHLSAGGEPDRFARRLGVAPRDDAETRLVGYTDSVRVHVTTRGQTAEEIEVTLAHEFAHVIHRNEIVRLEIAGPNPDGVERAVIEGDATFVEHAYATRYANRSALREWERRYRTDSAYGKYVHGPYYFGARYFLRRGVEPDDTTAVFADPPRTTEQVVHGYAPGQEPPTPLAVRVETGSASWQRAPAWQEDAFADTRGELFLRAALSRSITAADARRAAAGWGNDTVVTFYDGAPTDDPDATGYAWVLRWDSPDERREFVDLAAPVNVTSTDDTTARVVVADPETTVVFVGPPSFVGSMDADANASTVSLLWREADDRTTG